MPYPVLCVLIKAVMSLFFPSLAEIGSSSLCLFNFVVNTALDFFCVLFSILCESKYAKLAVGLTCNHPLWITAGFSKRGETKGSG